MTQTPLSTVRSVGKLTFRLGLMGIFVVVFLTPIMKAVAESPQWVQRATQGPTGRAAFGMAFDSARSVTTLFGGITPSEPWVYSGETWEWDGNTWTQRLVTGPQARAGAAMAYDSNRGVMVLFGGITRTGSGNPYQSDETWEWNGTVWTLRAVGGPRPRHLHALAFDSARNVTVMFGGVVSYPDGAGPLGETWEWNGMTWTQRAIGEAAPSTRYWLAMSYDAQNQETVLFGGESPSGDSSETWTWDGTTWTKRASNGPSGRREHMMSYDAPRGVTVLVGGYATSQGGDIGETWEWNGNAWHKLIAAIPQPRLQGGLVYDSERRVSVLFGGALASSYDGQTWELGTPCVGDLSGDHVVDDADFSLFAFAYDILVCSDPAMTVGCPADLNVDGVVDDADFVLFAVAYESLLCE